MPIISAIGIYNRRPDILRLRRIGLRSSGRIRPTISVANKRVEAAGWRAWMPPLYHQHLRGVPMAKPQNNPAQRRFNRHRRSMTGFSPDFGASCRVSHSTISRLLASGWGIKLEGRYPALTIGSGGNVDADGCAKNSATERKERVDAPSTGLGSWCVHPAIGKGLQCYCRWLTHERAEAAGGMGAASALTTG